MYTSSLTSVEIVLSVGNVTNPASGTRGGRASVGSAALRGKLFFIMPELASIFHWISYEEVAGVRFDQICLCNFFFKSITRIIQSVLNLKGIQQNQ